VDKIERTSTEIRSELDTLQSTIDTLARQWTGGASEAFQAKIHQWQTAADDLRQSLTRLGKIVHTTNANYQSALTTNTRMWPTR
jgi:WXG100 family type VII secretion target